MLALLAHTAGNQKLKDTLEKACVVSEYYKALKNNTRLPLEAFPSLEDALQCNRIRKQYISRANLSLKDGLRLVNSTLTVKQVVWTWNQLHENAVRFGFTSALKSINA